MTAEYKFYSNLKLRYGLSKEDLETQEFTYRGGDYGRHYNYFKLCYRKELKDNPNWQLAPHTDKCICDHDIVKNCYLVNKDGDVLVLGNCCIKRYMPENRKCRTCEKCGKSHLNRKVNRCNDCRVGLCDLCDRPIHKKYSKCYDCGYSGSHSSTDEEETEIQSIDIEDLGIETIGKIKYWLNDENDDLFEYISIGEVGKYVGKYKNGALMNFSEIKSKVFDTLYFTPPTDSIYLNVPYSEKDAVKAYGAKWDSESKKWWVQPDNIHLEIILGKWGIKKQETTNSVVSSKIYINVPFSEKENAKSHGAKWDSESKKWWVPSNIENIDEILSKWTQCKK